MGAHRAVTARQLDELLSRIQEPCVRSVAQRTWQIIAKARRGVDLGADRPTTVNYLQ